MAGKVARGTYLLVVATMIVVWLVTFNKEAPAAPQPEPQVWQMYS
jgi:hypothetical protein